jgi:hypothetical protein
VFQATDSLLLNLESQLISSKGSIPSCKDMLPVAPSVIDRKTLHSTDLLDSGFPHVEASTVDERNVRLQPPATRGWQYRTSPHAWLRHIRACGGQ